MAEWKSNGDGTFVPVNDAAKAIQFKRDKRDGKKEVLLLSKSEDSKVIKSEDSKAVKKVGK